MPLLSLGEEKRKFGLCELFSFIALYRIRERDAPAAGATSLLEEDGGQLSDAGAMWEKSAS